MGRHFLTADSEEEALELAYSHGLTHYLIDSSEIGKYSAYSNIGSDAEYDKIYKRWANGYVSCSDGYYRRR